MSIVLISPTSPQVYNPKVFSYCLAMLVSLCVIGEGIWQQLDYYYLGTKNISHVP
jgi:hypothetical protein